MFCFTENVLDTNWPATTAARVPSPSGTGPASLFILSQLWERGGSERSGQWWKYVLRGVTTAGKWSSATPGRSAASPGTLISHSLGKLDSPTVHLHRLNPIVGLLLSNSSENNLFLDHSEDDYICGMFFSPLWYLFLDIVNIHLSFAYTVVSPLGKKHTIQMSF